ncbi:MAG: DUF89 family protein [Spirochaetales bacterium]|nr:DUF89 family protein [Spirochaetales bacterium]
MCKKDNDVKYFSAAEKDSFAEFTIKHRFPKIFSDYCSGSYEDFTQKTLIDALHLEMDESKEKSLSENIKSLSDKINRTKVQLAAAITNDENKQNLQVAKDFINAFATKEKKHLIKADKREELNSLLDLTLQEIFEYAPFFEAEIIFYHAILAEKGYFDKKTEHNSLEKYDFFGSEKKNSVLNSKDKFIRNLDEMVSKESLPLLDEKEFIKAMHYSLSANTSDLSQLNSKERFDYTADDIRILRDDSLILYEYLTEKQEKKECFKRFDIICDNAGKELFSDVYLACYFLSNHLTEKVVFHLKPYPFFVSDATKEDFGYLVSEIQKAGKGNGSQLFCDYIKDGKIEITSDDFWARPLCFKNYKGCKDYNLTESDLIVVKGDLNYRRLVEDADWPYTDSFQKRTSNVFGNAPIIAPRVLKSDVLVGIDESSYYFAKSTDKLNAQPDQRFKGNGKWAVIHFRHKDYNEYKTKYEKRKQTQSDSNNQNKKGLSSAKCESENKMLHILKFFIDNYKALLLISIICLTLYIPFMICNDGGICYSPKIDFVLLITGYGFLLSGSILIPEFLMKNKIKEAMAEEKQKNADEITQMVYDRFSGKMDELAGERYKLDGDLSRMIAFILKKENPIWAMGWSLHALKTYIDSAVNNPRKEMAGFADVLLNSIIKPVVNGVVYIWGAQRGQYLKQIQCMFPEYDITDDTVSRTACMIHQEADDRHESNPLRAALSMIKDAIDVEYSLKYNTKSLDKESDFYQKCLEVSLYLGGFIRFIVYVLCCFDISNKTHDKPNYRFFRQPKDFISELFKLSRNDNTERYRKDVETTVYHICHNVFNLPRPVEVTNDLCINQLKRIYNKEDENNQMYFFVGEDYCVPMVE